MPRIHRRAARRLAALLALLALGAFDTAAAQTGSFESWVLVNEGCSQLVDGRLELRTCYEPGDVCDWSRASMTATVPGTFSVDLVWDITGVKEYTECIISVDSQLGYAFVKGAAFIGTDAWCEPQPCGGATQDISFEVAAGDVVRFELTNHGEPCFGGDDGTRCVFENLSFTPAPGIHPLGFGLAAAPIHEVGVAEPPVLAGVQDIDVLPDLDGDGIADSVIGAPGSDQLSGNLGRVRVHSGADGALLAEHLGASGGWLGWSVTAAGDLDGDGVHDYAAGAPRHPGGFNGPGRVDAWSGADGSLLLGLIGPSPNSRFGWCIDGVGDVNGDGFDDLVVGSPGEGSSQGAVRVYSGADGGILHHLPGSAALARLGETVAGVGDADADGVPDFAAAAPGTAVGGLPGAGEVFVWSGATGAVLLLFQGTHNSEALTREIEGVGDFDGDGHDDFAFGDTTVDSKDALLGIALMDAGLFEIRSGKDGHRLLKRYGTQAHGHLGRDVAALGDLDGDGFPDVAVGEPGFGTSGRVQIVGGPQGRLLLDARSPNHRDVGRVVSGGADLDGDGRGDLLLGLTTPAGVHRVLALDTEAALQDQPQLEAQGSLQAGLPLKLNVIGGPPQALAVLVMGHTAQDLPLLGGIVVPAADLLVPGLMTNAAGRLAVTSSWPTGPAALLPLVVQVWMTSPDAASGFEATNAVALTP
ncbi:MAG TPA: integrin alpha [Planctomycetota bacterium]|nr:integrin alpha [Planctomycetota bacterium]